MKAEESGQDHQQHWGWLNNMPPAFRILVAWIRWLVRPVLALVALYSCLVLLQTMRRVPALELASEPTHEPTSAAVFQRLELEPVQGVPINYDRTVSYELSGQTTPGSRIEVVSGWSWRSGRQLGTVVADSAGHFAMSIQIPLQVQQVRVSIQNPESRQVDDQDIGVPWQDGDAILAPFLDVAIYATDTGWLWVAGQTIPDASIRLETENGEHLATIPANYFGAFDEFISLDTAPTSPLRARLMDSDVAPPSGPVSVTHLLSSDFPLTRTLDVHLNAERPTLDLQVWLPRRHPYFSALAQGHLTPDRFVRATVGELARSWSIVYTPTLSTRADVSLVDLKGHWIQPFSEFTLDEWPTQVDDMLFLSASDIVRLHFEGVRPAWFAEPLPEMTGDSAIWQGPAYLSVTDAPLIRVSVVLPESASISREAEPEPQEESSPVKPGGEQGEKEQVETVRELAAGVEYRTIFGFTWATLIRLVPYAGLLWLARRRMSDETRIWRPIVAAVSVLAIWRSIYYFRFLLLTGPVLRLLDPIMAHVLNALGKTGGTVWRIYGERYRFEASFTSCDNAFWLLFVAFVGLAPFYLSMIESKLGWRPTLSSSKRSPWHRIGIGFRVLYGFLMLALLCWMTWRSSEFLGWVRQYLLQPWLYADVADELARLLASTQLQAVLQVALFVLFLLALNWRATVFGFGLLAVVIRATVPHIQRSLETPDNPLNTTVLLDYDLLDVVARLGEISWPAIFIFAGLAAYPLVLWLLRKLLPSAKPFNRRWLPGVLALTLIVASIMLPDVPPTELVAISGGLVLLAAGWLVARGWRELETVKRLRSWSSPWRWVVVIALVLIAFAITRPTPDPEEVLRFRDIGHLMSELSGVFFYVLALTLVLWMHSYASRNAKGSVVLDEAALDAATVLFAAFVINSLARWLFIPVSFLVGLLVARFWLFRPADEMAALQPAMEASARNRPRLIQGIVDAASAKTRLENIRKTLTSKLESAELTPEQYEERLDNYRQYFQEKLASEVVHGHQSRDTVLAVGETDVWKNATIAVRYGAILALVPLLISLYEYFPNQQVDYPYPLVDLVAFLIRAPASWLLYAFLFGYCYVHLRGNSGLTKGFYLCIAIVIPFAAYRLLNTESLAQMQSFLLWAVQIFFFCILLGLSMDYRLLRQNGFRLRDLSAFYSLPTLSFYASTAIAAAAPAIAAVLAQGLGKGLSALAAFFFEAVLPGGGGGRPQQ